MNEFILAPGNLDALTEYLRKANWLGPGESVKKTEKAGEGNMNCTLRVITTERSIILKQSRPWVAKYPQIPAPVERTAVEAAFYRETSGDAALVRHMPRLFQFDSQAHLLMMEDLGPAQDFTFLYGPDNSSAHQPAFAKLTRFLIDLHHRHRSENLRAPFQNHAMRKLNHEHIFDLPLRKESGIGPEAFTPGLRDASALLVNDADYVARVTDLGRQYLDASRGSCLIHGDFFPGSWLCSAGEVYVIDPEFCFFGQPEWDFGVMMAHLYLARLSRKEVNGLADLYQRSAELNIALVNQFAGVEIMRRLIGVAQLPMSRTLAEKRQLLELSRSMVLEECNFA